MSAEPSDLELAAEAFRAACEEASQARREHNEATRKLEAAEQRKNDARRDLLRIAAGHETEPRVPAF